MLFVRFCLLFACFLSAFACCLHAFWQLLLAVCLLFVSLCLLFCMLIEIFCLLYACFLSATRRPLAATIANSLPVSQPKPQLQARQPVTPSAAELQPQPQLPLTPWSLLYHETLCGFRRASADLPPTFREIYAWKTIKIESPHVPTKGGHTRP